MNDQQAKAVQIIARIAEADPADVTHDRTLVSLGINSPKALELLVELEDSLNVEISDQDAAQMETVGDVLSFLESA